MFWRWTLQLNIPTDTSTYSQLVPFRKKSQVIIGATVQEFLSGIGLYLVTGAQTGQQIGKIHPDQFFARILVLDRKDGIVRPVRMITDAGGHEIGMSHLPFAQRFRSP